MRGELPRGFLRAFPREEAPDPLMHCPRHSSGFHKYMTQRSQLFACMKHTAERSVRDTRVNL